jgi:hypothetical protein
MIISLIQLTAGGSREIEVKVQFGLSNIQPLVGRRQF